MPPKKSHVEPIPPSSSNYTSPLGLPSTVPDHENPADAPNLQNPQEKLTVYMMPEDARDKVLCAIIRALLKTGNVPATPKELCALIQKGGLANLGGNTPHATVSSRISQLYKRCNEAKPPRMPILGKWSVDGERRLRYYVDQPPIPWHPVTEQRLALSKNGNISQDTVPELSTVQVTIQPINLAISSRYSAPIITNPSIGKTSSITPVPVATQAQVKEVKRRDAPSPSRSRRISSSTRDAALSLTTLAKGSDDGSAYDDASKSPSPKKRKVKAKMDPIPDPLDTPKKPSRHASPEPQQPSPDPYSQDEVEFNPPIPSDPPILRRSTRSLAVSVNVSPDVPSHVELSPKSPPHPHNIVFAPPPRRASSPQQEIHMITSPISGRLKPPRHSTSVAATPSRAAGIFHDTTPQLFDDQLSLLPPSTGRPRSTVARKHQRRDPPSRKLLNIPPGKDEVESEEEDVSPSPLKRSTDDHASYKTKKFKEDKDDGDSGFGGPKARSIVTLPTNHLRSTRTTTSSTSSTTHQTTKRSHTILPATINFLNQCSINHALENTNVLVYTAVTKKPRFTSPDADTDVEVESKSSRANTPKPSSRPGSRQGSIVDRRLVITTHDHDDVQVVKEYVATALGHSPISPEEAGSGYTSPIQDDTESFFNFSEDEVDTMISKTVPVSPSSARTGIFTAFPGLVEMRQDFKTTHSPHVAGIPHLDLSKLVLIPPHTPPSGTHPIFMTVVDKVACFLTFLPPPNGLKASHGPLTSDSTKLAPGNNNVTLGFLASQIPVLRRMDNHAVNVSSLLLAGGLLSERERDNALVLELQKVKIRKKKGLMGTWVPLHRARDTAKSYVLETKLGGFLIDGLLKNYFGQSDDNLPMEIKLILRKNRGHSAPPLSISAPSSPMLRPTTPKIPLKTAPSSPLSRPRDYEENPVISRLQALVSDGGPLRPSSPLAREVTAVVRSLSPGLEDRAPSLKPALQLLNATLTSIATGNATPLPAPKPMTRQELDSPMDQPPTAVVHEKFLIHLAGDAHFLPETPLESSPKKKEKKPLAPPVEVTPVDTTSALQDMIELEEILDSGAYLEVEVVRKVEQVSTVVILESEEEPKRKKAKPPKKKPKRSPSPAKIKKKKEPPMPPIGFFTVGPAPVLNVAVEPPIEEVKVKEEEEEEEIDIMDEDGLNDLR